MKVLLFFVIYLLFFYVVYNARAFISPDHQNGFSLTMTILSVLYWSLVWGSIVWGEESREDIDGEKQI